jgi:chromosome segregation ATPase
MKRKRTQRKSAASGKWCAAILAKLDKIDGLPMKVRTFVDRIRVGLTAKDARHLDAEKAATLLGKALREIGSSLHTRVQERKVAVAGAEHEEKSRQEALTAAADKVSSLRQSAADCKSGMQRAGKEIDTGREKIKGAKSACRSSAGEAEKIQDRKRHLEIAEREAFEPLREAPARGSQGNKRLATLRRTGKAFGFHNELLNVAGIVLKKQLASRRTFDNDVLQNLAREFEKSSTILDVASRESEQAVVARENAVALATECYAAAKASRKQHAADLAVAEQAIVEGLEDLSEAKHHLRSFPTHVKTIVKELERAQHQLDRFCSGPQAMYDKKIGALAVRAKVPSDHECSAFEDSADADADASEPDVGTLTQP